MQIYQLSPLPLIPLHKRLFRKPPRKTRVQLGLMVRLPLGVNPESMLGIVRRCRQMRFDLVTDQRHCAIEDFRAGP